jgi:hypothetical protein
VYVDDKARRVLGYQPRYDLQRGIAMSGLWMSRNGYFDGPLPEAVRMPEPVHVQTAETIEYREPAAAAN